MLEFFVSPLFLFFARLCVGGVFLVSGAGKLFDRAGTEASMSRYTFLPIGSGKIIAVLFPVLELLVGILLVLGLFTSLAALVGVLLFVLFTGLVIYDLSRGKYQSCHCFGRLSEEKLTPMAVVRNLALLVLAALVAVGFDGWLSLDNTLGIAGSARTAGAGSAVDAIPVALLAIATVGAIVFGGQVVSMIRTTLRVLGFR